MIFIDDELSSLFKTIDKSGGGVRTNMIILNIRKFFNCSIEFFLWMVIMLINKVVFQRIEVPFLSIGALSYGYLALLILWVIPRHSQYSVNSLGVYWLPWSECSISLCRSIPGYESIDFCRVLFARSEVIFLSLMPATTLRS